MNETTKPVHPLFDEGSEYRLATRTSVWHDDGVESVVNFFLDRARERGLAGDDELDQSIAEFLQSRERAASEQAATSRGELIDKASDESDRTAAGTVISGSSTGGRPRAEELSQPAAASSDRPSALLQLDFQTEQPSASVGLPRRDDSIFPGGGRRHSGPAYSETFSLNVSELPKNCRWLALVLEPLHLEYLKAVLGQADRANWDPLAPLPQEQVTDEQDAVRVIQESLSYETLVPQEDDKRERASRLSLLLSLAPALQGTTGEVGRIAKTIPLGHRCPVLEPGSWVVVCLDKVRVPSPWETTSSTPPALTPPVLAATPPVLVLAATPPVLAAAQVRVPLCADELEVEGHSVYLIPVGDGRLEVGPLKKNVTRPDSPFLEADATLTFPDRSTRAVEVLVKYSFQDDTGLVVEGIAYPNVERINVEKAGDQQVANFTVNIPMLHSTGQIRFQAYAHDYEGGGKYRLPHATSLKPPPQLALGAEHRQPGHASEISLEFGTSPDPIDVIVAESHVDWADTP